MSAATSALVISAHAADFVWRCGGAIALHAERGCAVTVLCLSFGERGESARLWKEGRSLQEIKDIRRGEAAAAAKALGVQSLVCLDLGDYPLDFSMENKMRIVDVIRQVQPDFMLSHSQYDPYNTDHMKTTEAVLEARMIAQAWGHNPGDPVLGAPQLYLFEPHQTEQMGWRPDTFLDITPVWDKKRAAMECMNGQAHLWEYYTRVAEQRANHFKRNSGGQAGGRDCRYAEGFQSVFPRTVDSL
ncbi:PIG-L deacetylase family protein [Nioella nitratireducens]|uniref:PIG-L deacetylase family protein n=1 Tax=Nioella nitratireducens TaxID=1287720 RepID=UPI0008FD5554|nr:PIG-L deacetylase family protein [Nioella nitratireducens]